MKVTTNIAFDFDKSLDRMDKILDSTCSYDTVEDVPNSESMGYSDGNYFKCYAIFIDIRSSSTLPDKYAKKTLAKIYRAYISEIVALFQSFDNCKEINIVGDSVWAVFSSKKKSDVLQVFCAGYTAQSIVKSINYKLCKKGISAIKIGTGIDKGSALMIKAGYSGSGLNDVVYMGGVVNNASNLCSYGNKDFINSLVISEPVYNDLLNEHNGNKYYQSFFKWDYIRGFYHASMINNAHEQWITIQQLDSPCYKL